MSSCDGGAAAAVLFGGGGRPRLGVPPMAQPYRSAQESAATPSSKSSPAPTDLVALAGSCGARHILLRACPPSHGGWPGSQGHVALVHRASRFGGCTPLDLQVPIDLLRPSLLLLLSSSLVPQSLSAVLLRHEWMHLHCWCIPNCESCSVLSRRPLLQLKCASVLYYF